MYHRCRSISGVLRQRRGAICTAALVWFSIFCIYAPRSANAADPGSSILDAELSNLKPTEAERAALLQPIPVIPKQVPRYTDSATFEVHIDGHEFKLPKGVRVLHVFAGSDQVTPSVSVNVKANGFAQERVFKKSKRIDEYTPLRQDQIDLNVFGEVWRIPSSLESLTATWNPKVPYSLFSFSGIWGNDPKHLHFLVFMYFSEYKGYLPNGPNWLTAGVETGLGHCGYSDAEIERFTRSALKNLHSLGDEEFDRRLFAINGESLKNAKQPMTAAENGILLALKAGIRTWTKAYEISTNDGNIYVIPMKSDRSTLGRYIVEGFDQRGAVRWSMDLNDKSTLINNEDGAIELVCRILDIKPARSTATK